MRWVRAMSLLFAVTLPLFSCSGEKSDMLSRDTAASLMEKDPYYESYLRARDVDVEIPDLFYELDHDDPGLPQFYTQCYQARTASNKLFYERLVAAGIVKAKATQRGTGYDANYHPVPATIYEYGPADPNVRTMRQPQPNQNGFVTPGMLSIKVAVAHFGKVTGVTQQGIDASADVEVSSATQPLAGRLSSAIQETLQKTAPVAAGGSAACSTTVWAPLVPVMQRFQTSASQSTTVTFRFKKYDDGWRPMH